MEYSTKNVSGSGYDVTVLVEAEDKPCYLVISLPQFSITRIDGVYNNTRMLSASLRDTLGYQTAVEFLTAHNVPHSSGLWDLNHSNPWRE